MMLKPLLISLVFVGCNTTASHTQENVKEEIAHIPIPHPPKAPPPVIVLPQPEPVVDVFQESECLKDAVDFWEMVYMEFPSSKVFIYNERTFEIYYKEYVQLRNRARKQYVKNMVRAVANKLPKEERHLVRAQGSAQNKFLSALEIGKDKIPQIQQIMRDNNLPEDLALLPLIESSFQNTARSPVGALGPWQIMPGTLRLYSKAPRKNLKDLTFSTNIAVKILKDNYELLGSWPLAINAYHSGPGRLLKAKQQFGTTDMCIITDKFEGRGYKFHSRNYYAQFLAARRLYYKYINGKLNIDKPGDNLVSQKNSGE
jgi:membrane-bound lytic murein transglycosylase D